MEAMGVLSNPPDALRRLLDSDSSASHDLDQRI